MHLASLTAEAGKTYYFAAVVTVASRDEVIFGPSQLNDDEGTYRVKASKVSNWKKK